MATYLQSDVSFFLKLLCYPSLMFLFFHIILTSCVCEDAKSSFCHLLHIILLETVSKVPLPKFPFLLILTDLRLQALNSHFRQSPVSLVKAGNKRGAPSAYGVTTFLLSKSGRTQKHMSCVEHELPRAALPTSTLLISPSLAKFFIHTLALHMMIISSPVFSMKIFCTFFTI